MINYKNYISKTISGHMIIFNKRTGEPCSNSFAEHLFNSLASKSAGLKHNARKSNAYHDYFRVGDKALYTLANNVLHDKSIVLVNWILNHMNVATNKLKCTYSSVVKALHMNRSTISKTYKRLKYYHIAKIHSGCIFVNPELAIHGNTSRYIRIYNDYYNTSESWWKHPDTNDEFTPKNV